MRKTLALLAIPAILFGTVAADGDDAFEPCGEDLEHPVLASGETLSESPEGEATYEFYVDPTVAERGRVNVSGILTWENPLTDWDLDINGILSENAQPIDEPSESATLSARGDCTLVTVRVYPFNVWGTLPPGPMALDITVG